MDTYIIRFLARNKYPEVKNELITLIVEWENLPTDGEIDANLTLAMQNMGVGGVENLEKAVNWVQQMDNSFLKLNLLTIIYLRKGSTDYSDYLKNYEYLMSIINNINFIEDDNDELVNIAYERELLWRFLKLLVGYTKDNSEYELSANLLKLCDINNLDKIKIDIIINSKSVNYNLIKWSIPFKNPKLDYLCEKMGEL